MKALLASLVIAAAAAAAWSAPATAESSYWDSRYRDARDRSHDRYDDRGYDGRRAYRRDDGVTVEIRKRRPRAPLYSYRGGKPRSYNGPVYQSQEQVQQSVYDFSTGGPGDINAYR